MNKLFLPIVAFLFACSAFAQSSETDSLKRLLQHAKEDHEQVMNLEALSYAYLSLHPDTALQYAQKGQALAQKIKDAAGEASCVVALGNAYFHLDDYAKALAMYLQALKMKEALKAQNFSVLYFNMADVYTSQGDFGHALQYLHKAMADDQKRKDSSGILFDLYTLGVIYHRMNKPDSALHYDQQALALGYTLGDEALLGAILDNHASVYSGLHNYPLAVRYYHESLAASASVDDKEVMTEDYFGLANIYNETGRSDSANFYAYKALALAQAAPFLKQLVDISRFLADRYRSEKRWDSAYKYFTLSTATKDSLFNVEEAKKIQTMKFTEQQRQQAIQNADEEYHQRIKLYLVLVASLVLLAIALVLWRTVRQKQKAYNLLQEQKQKTDDALRELKTTQAQLIQAEKMASLGELTAGIAHEIQNPLNFVNNFSELSVELADELKEELEGTPLPEKQKQALQSLTDELAQNQQKISRHGKRAGAIVKSMLQHSRRSGGAKEPTDINALVDEYLRLSYHGFCAKHSSFNASLQTHFDETVGTVALVRHHFGRVLVNIFNNAFYALWEKSEGLNSSFEPTIEVETKRKADVLEIRIHDNGSGIPAGSMDKLFQPFFTTKPTGQGVGLGLSLAYDVITKEHNGSIVAESKEGEGSVFTIQLAIA